LIFDKFPCRRSSLLLARIDRADINQQSPRAPYYTSLALAPSELKIIALL
jgi:hypothetical protein